MKRFKKVRLSEEEKDALKTLITDFELEDKSVRDRQIRTWKSYEYYWCGLKNHYWDSVAHDWRVAGTDTIDDWDANQSEYYDKNINVFRAYLETIIAALSQTVPPVKCGPDDAENINDVLTARGGSKIAELVANHNDAPLLWIQALWNYCLYGMVAAWNYTDDDSSYGEVPVREYDEETVDGMQSVCPNCGTVISEEEIGLSEDIKRQEEDEYDPGDDDILMGNVIDSGKMLCPKCMVDIDPELKQNKIVVTRLTGITNQPKSRQCIEVHGGLFVKVPNWARSQKDCLYLGYSCETHFGNILQEFPDLRDEISDLGTKVTSPDGNQVYERWGRLSPQYNGEYPLNTPTLRRWWLRPAAFNTLTDDDMVKRLKKKFPAGAYVILVNDNFVQACNESLDDHWTITYNPLSDYVHFDPLASLLVAIQDITTDLVSLELQTIEHSVPITFASPKRVNFEQLRNNEVTPGAVYPTMVSNNKSMSDDFFQLSTATVSPELNNFSNKVGELGQFTSGALPALYGGTQQASSRTASQYAMQGNRALQRLQMPYKMINFWWKNIFAKVIPAYIKNMLDDERLVKPVGKENFIQIAIKKSQLDGKIGDVYLEAPDGLPQTMNEIKSTLMELLQTQNPAILEAIGQPENIPLVQNIFGMTGFVMPGEKDREKQYEEISILITSAPLDDQTPSIMPELMVDNHKVESEVMRDYLVGEKGRQLKSENPDGYKNCLLHLQMHVQMMQFLMQPPPSPVPGGQSVQPSESSNKLHPVSAEA